MPVKPNIWRNPQQWLNYTTLRLHPILVTKSPIPNTLLSHPPPSHIPNPLVTHLHRNWLVLVNTCKHNLVAPFNFTQTLFNEMHPLLLQYTVGYVEQTRPNAPQTVVTWMFKAMGGAPKKQCGICWPTLYSAATSVGGHGSEVAGGQGPQLIINHRAPQKLRIELNVNLRAWLITITIKLIE